VIKLWKESKRASGFPASVISKPAPRLIFSLYAKAKNHLPPNKKVSGPTFSLLPCDIIVGSHHGGSATAIAISLSEPLEEIPQHSTALGARHCHEELETSWCPNLLSISFLSQSNEHPYYGQIGATDLSSNSFGGVELLFMGHLHRQP
jgi:hypothetical protein